MAEERAGPEDIVKAIEFVLTRGGDIATLIMNGVLYICICITIIMIALTVTAATMTWGDPWRWFPKSIVSFMVFIFLAGIYILAGIPIMYPTL